MSAAPAGAPQEARSFAETVGAIAERHSRPDPWRPGAHASDANPALDKALREVGWHELAATDELLQLAAPAGAALGRALAPLAPVDALLGGALKVEGLARYAQHGRATVEPRTGRVVTARAEHLTPVPYGDALGVAAVRPAPRPGSVVHAASGDTGAATVDGELPPQEAHRRMAAWAAASTGYLAGLAETALRLALEHAHSRRAFGGPLTALEPVQQLLADAAALSDGLTLLSSSSPGLDEHAHAGDGAVRSTQDQLAHAGDAAVRVTGSCVQVTGALGFTLEFPLQRVQRRARSCRAWADGVLVGWEKVA